MKTHKHKLRKKNTREVKLFSDETYFVNKIIFRMRYILKTELRFVIVVFSDQTHLLFCSVNKMLSVAIHFSL